MATSQGEHSDQQELVACIDALRDEVRVLRDAVDELREELQYLVRNTAAGRPSSPSTPLQITSLALDPAADNFGEQITAVPAIRLDELRVEVENAAEKPAEPDPTGQRELF